MASYINTPFVITNAQKKYPENTIWVSFSGSFTDTGIAQTIGTHVIDDFSSTWRSYAISDLKAPVTNLPYFSNKEEFTFSFNGFSGRIYINYGSTPLQNPPNPSAPGTSPYIVFEATILGETLPAPTPSASNVDLSYVDGVSAPASTATRNATTGDLLLATSVNPVIASNEIMKNVEATVPKKARVLNQEKLIRIKSSAAAPSDYHTWAKLINDLQTTTNTRPLNICSYISPDTEIPLKLALSGVLFGYSGAPPISGQVPGFETKQDYTCTAEFTANLNPDSNQILSDNGIKPGTGGVEIKGSGTVSGQFKCYITQKHLDEGTGIYGNNPSYTVIYKNNGSETGYRTTGIVNDLGGRIVGDLMAGMVFGWSASNVNIVEHAQKTNTELFGTTFSEKTVGGISTGELFFLLSLAGTQGTLSQWVGPNLDSEPEHYDEYLFAITNNSSAYGSGFTDRLEGYSSPDTYWYTANPPAIPGGSGNYETIGFVNLFLGCAEEAE